MMDSAFKDLQFALRSLIKRPGFTAVAVITLMLAIGVNTTIFSVVNAVLLRAVVIGIAGALVLTRFLATLLFGITPTDTLTFVVVSASFFLLAMLASFIPARRADKVDPLIALRYE